jgi:hypothetical protein
LIISAQEHPLVAGLGGLEEVLLALQALPGLELGVLVHEVLRDEPADVALHPERPAHHDGARLVDVLLVLVGVLPVLEDGVDLAVGHRLVDRDLRDLRDLDLAAELVLEHVLRNVGVGGRAGPSLLVQHDLAAVLAAGRRALTPAGVVFSLPAGRDEQRKHERRHPGPQVPVGFQTAPPPG